MDITNAAEIQALLEVEKPDFVVHAAAQRAPDKVENDYESTRQLNVTASKNITEIASKLITCITTFTMQPMLEHIFCYLACLTNSSYIYLIKI